MLYEWTDNDPIGPWAQMCKSTNPLEMQNRNKPQKRTNHCFNSLWRFGVFLQPYCSLVSLCGASVSLHGFRSLCGGFEVAVHLFVSLSSGDAFWLFVSSFCVCVFLYLNAYMPIAHVLHLTDEYASVIFGPFIMSCLSGNISAQLKCVTAHKFRSSEMVPHALVLAEK